MSPAPSGTSRYLPVPSRTLLDLPAPSCRPLLQVKSRFGQAEYDKRTRQQAQKYAGDETVDLS